MDKLEIKTEITKAMQILEYIDTTNYQKRTYNQEQVNKAYNILDKLINKVQEEIQMNREKQIEKVNNLYNSICCLLVYEDKQLLNENIDIFKNELEKLKLQEVPMNREDLKSYKHNQKWIEGRLEYLESYKASITRTTTVMSDMPKRKQRSARRYGRKFKQINGQY